MSEEKKKLTPVNRHLIQAMYDWMVENNLTPHIVVPKEYVQPELLQYVRGNCIVLNISTTSCPNLVIGKDWVEFSTRFSGKQVEVAVPTNGIVSIFPREHQDLSLTLDPGPVPEVYSSPTITPPPETRPRPKLSIVK